MPEYQIGGVKVIIGGDAGPLDKASKQAQSSLGGLDARVKQSAKLVGALALATAALGAAIIAHQVKASLEAIDTQSKLARSLGGTTLGVQALEHAAKLAGIENGALAASMQAFNQRLDEATRLAKGPAYDALVRLGLTTKQLAALDVDERVAVIADRIQKLGLSAQATASTLRDLGIRSKEMVGLVNEGGEGIRAARQELKDLGIAVSDVDARQIEKFNDQVTRLGTVIRGIGNQLAVQLAAPLKVVADYLFDGAKKAGGFQSAIERMVQIGIRAVAEMQVAVFKLNREWTRLFGTDAEWEKVKKNWGNAPNADALVQYFNKMIGLEKLRTAFEEQERGKRNESVKESGRILTSEEAKSYADKLLRLRASLASEDMALRLHLEKQNKDIKEFQSLGLINQDEASRLRLEAETRYYDNLQNLIATKFTSGMEAELEMLRVKYEQQLMELQKFEENQTITVENAEKLRAQIRDKYATDTAQMQARSWSGLASVVDGAMSNISSIIGDEGKKGFTLMKGIAAATALVKGYEAAVSSYAAGAKVGGPALGAAFAGISLAGTAAYIAKLAGVGPDGGGAAAAAGGGGTAGTTSSAAAAPAPSQQTLVVEGWRRNARWSDDEVRELYDRIQEYDSDGSASSRRIVFA